MNNMKTTKTLALLLAMLAAGNSAQAQTQQLIEGRPYTFTGTPATAGTGNVTYQWWRNGELIPGATGQDYIMVHYLAQGINVELKRGVISSTCPGSISYTNTVTVSFGMVVGSLLWASVNVAAYQTFAARPDQYTQFYQWNRTQAWSATAATVSNWGTTIITDAAWLVNPCPSGWRLSTQAEMTALINTGSAWADINTRGNAVAGRFFGPGNASCSLPNNMLGCLFIPAGGDRNYTTGELEYTNYGYSWTSTQLNSNNGNYLAFTSTSCNVSGNNKAYGMPIRCVIPL